MLLFMVVLWGLIRLLVCCVFCTAIIHVVLLYTGGRRVPSNLKEWCCVTGVLLLVFEVQLWLL